MGELFEGLRQGFWLLVTLDGDLVAITLRSLHVTLAALVVASILAFPLAAFLAVRRFRFQPKTEHAVSATRTRSSARPQPQPRRPEPVRQDR